MTLSLPLAVLISLIAGAPPPRGGRPPIRFVFPPTMPAFEDTGVRAAPDGTIWVERLLPAADTMPSVDVLNLEGRRIARVQLPPRASVVGFGRGVIYVAEKNDVDEVFVRRYANPVRR